MINFIRNLSDKAEFIFVILVAFGFFTYAAVAHFLVSPGRIVQNDSSFWGLLVYETIALTVLVIFLRIRNYDFASLGLQFRWSDLLIAIGLYLACYALYIPSWIIYSHVFPDSAHQLAFTASARSQITLLPIVLVSILNPIYEELLVLGYVMQKLRSNKYIYLGLAVSIFIRVAYHVYQGPMALIFIFPVGLVFGVWYFYQERLWPVILVHMAMDFLGLYQLIE